MFTYDVIIFIINIVYTYFVFVQPKYTVKLWNFMWSKIKKVYHF